MLTGRYLSIWAIQQHREIGSQGRSIMQVPGSEPCWKWRRCVLVTLTMGTIDERAFDSIPSAEFVKNDKRA
eukprot:8489248-Heterocapsa_arctica.AAC.1